jgi:hypothetical protein
MNRILPAICVLLLGLVSYRAVWPHARQAVASPASGRSGPTLAATVATPTPAVAEPRRDAEAAVRGQIERRIERIARLKALLSERPALACPEVALLTEHDWAGLATSVDLDTEAGVRAALAAVRFTGENNAVAQLSTALDAFVRSHGGRLPDSPRQLGPYLDPSLAPAVLDRYTMLATGPISAVDSKKQGTGLMATLAPVDAELDTIWRIGVSGYSPKPALAYDVSQAQKQYAAANGGRSATVAQEIVPFLKWQVNPGAVQLYLASWGTHP